MRKRQRPLSRREREIMDVLYRRDAPLMVDEVLAAMPDPPSRSAVRTFLRILEAKGYVRHHVEGRRYLYQPVRSRIAAGRSAVRHLLETFFDGAANRAVAALLDASSDRLTNDELDELARLVDEARRRRS